MKTARLTTQKGNQVVVKTSKTGVSARLSPPKGQAGGSTIFSLDLANKTGNTTQIGRGGKVKKSDTISFA